MLAEKCSFFLPFLILSFFFQTRKKMQIYLFIYLFRTISSVNSSHAVRDLGRVRQYPPWLLFVAFVDSVGYPRYNPQKTRKQ